MREHKLAIVANSVRANTRSFQKLERFLGSLRIPMIAVLRDTQSFVHAAAHGLGICEMPAYAVRNDVGGLHAIARWLDRWRARRLDAEVELALGGLTDAEDWDAAPEQAD